MTDTPYDGRQLAPIALQKRLSAGIHSDTELLLTMASQLGPRDLAALSHIVRRTAQLCETEGEEIALAVLDQIMAILRNQPADA